MPEHRAIVGIANNPKLTMRRRLRKLRKYVRAANWILGSFLFSLLLLELLLRLFMPQVRAFTQPDDLLGYSFIPGAYYNFAPPEGCPGWGSQGTVNSHGLMDEEHAYEREPNTFRILALGDSYTEALQFPRDEIWPELLEAQLNARDDDLTYEVINAGRSGMGTALQYRYYTELGRRYNPDLVLLLWIGNDFVDNSKQLLPLAQPYYTLVDGELVLDDSFSRDPNYQSLKNYEWARQNLYFVSFLRQQLSAFTQERNLQAYEAARATTPEATAEANAQAQPAPAPEPADVLYEPFDVDTSRYTQAEQDAIAVTQRLLLELYGAIQADSADFLFILGSITSDVNYLAVEQGLYADFNSLETMADDIIGRFAREQSIPTFDVVMPLRRYSVENRVYLHGCPESGGGHWNRSAHQLVAAWLYDHLQANGYLPTDAPA